jgi:hypothetical protein
MAKNTTEPEAKISSTSRFNTVDAIDRLMMSMQDAIDNMIEEIRKPVDPEAGGAARKAELQSIKQTAVDCQELIKKYAELDDMKKQMADTGTVKEDRDYTAGFAERFKK